MTPSDLRLQGLRVDGGHHCRHKSSVNPAGLGRSLAGATLRGGVSGEAPHQSSEP